MEKCWAISPDDHDETLRLIQEFGASDDWNKETKKNQRSIILGLNGRRKIWQFANKNGKADNIIQHLTRMTNRYMQEFKYTTIQINMRRPGDEDDYPHRDGKNCGKSCIVGVGKYMGGELWIEQQGGPSSRKLDNGESCCGEEVDIRERLVIFDGKEKYHVPCPPSYGTRYSVTFFSPSYLGKAPGTKGAKSTWEATRRKLEAFGFPLPEDLPAFEQAAENQMPDGAEVRDIAPSAATTSRDGSLAAAPPVLEEGAQRREAKHVETGNRQLCAKPLAFLARSRAKFFSESYSSSPEHAGRVASFPSPKDLLALEQEAENQMPDGAEVRDIAPSAATTSRDGSLAAAPPVLEEAAQRREAKRIETGNQQLCPKPLAFIARSRDKFFSESYSSSRQQGGRAASTRGPDSLGSSGRQPKRTAIQCEKIILAAGGERQCNRMTRKGRFCWQHGDDEKRGAMPADPR